MTKPILVSGINKTPQLSNGTNSKDELKSQKVCQNFYLFRSRVTVLPLNPISIKLYAGEDRVVSDFPA